MTTRRDFLTTALGLGVAAIAVPKTTEDDRPTTITTHYEYTTTYYRGLRRDIPKLYIFDEETGRQISEEEFRVMERNWRAK